MVDIPVILLLYWLTLTKKKFNSIYFTFMIKQEIFVLTKENNSTH